MNKKQKLIKEAEQAVKNAKKNLAFLKATKLQQRIMIAKDVIALVKSKTLMPEQGTYLEPADTDADRATLGEKCQVCALGACFVSAARLDRSLDFNGVAARYTRIQDAMHNQLAPYFSEKELRLIEAAFEQDAGFAMSTSNWDVAQAARDYGIKYADDNERLLAIMNNIIRNKGTFKP